MRNLIESIIEKRFDDANTIAESRIFSVMTKKLEEMKKMISARLFVEMDLSKEPASSNIEDRRGTMVVDGNKSDKPNIINRRLKKDSEKPTEVTVKSDKEDIKEEELSEAQRVAIVKARIRNGKVQRRKKVSNVAGFTMRGGKLTRMSPSERRKRKMGQRKGKLKRKAKMTRTLAKRKRSLRKRAALGV